MNGNGVTSQPDAELGAVLILCRLPFFEESSFFKLDIKLYAVIILCLNSSFKLITLLVVAVKRKRRQVTAGRVLQLFVRPYLFLFVSIN